MDVFWNAWRRIELLLAVALIALSLVHMGQMMHAMATGSLSTDEFGTIGSFSSRGPGRVVTDYRAPKNHVLFNLLNSLLPGRESFDPARARVLSLLAVALTAAGILAHAAWRGRWMAGATLLALWTLAPQALSLSLEARGYGFIDFFGVAASIAALEYLREKNRRWLWTLAAATALGAYTVPSFLFFAGPLMLLVWLADRTRWSFFAGLAAAVTTLLLYAPILKPLLAVFTGYGDHSEHEADFREISGLLSAAKLYLLQAEDWQTWALLGVLALAPFAALARREDRAGLRVVAGAAIVFCLVVLALRTPPIRTAAFVFLPLGIAGLWTLGDALRIRAPWPPLVWTATGTLLLCGLFGTVRDFQFTPTENWTLAARGIDAAFPPGMRLDFQRYAKYLKQTLPDATARSADFDLTAFAEGRLVVADAGNKWATGCRFSPPAGMDRVVQWTVPGTIRDIVLTFRLPSDSGLAAAPAPLGDGRADTGVALQPSEVELHPAAGTTGHALVLLLDRAPKPHELTIEADGHHARAVVVAGNAVVIPLQPSKPATMRLRAAPGSNLTATEAWITR
jgi:hypothetical protein